MARSRCVRTDRQRTIAAYDRVIGLDLDPAAIEAALRKLVSGLNGADPLRRRVVREEAVVRLRRANVPAAAALRQTELPL